MNAETIEIENAIMAKSRAISYARGQLARLESEYWNKRRAIAEQQRDLQALVARKCAVMATGVAIGVQDSDLFFEAGGTLEL